MSRNVALTVVFVFVYIYWSTEREAAGHQTFFVGSLSFDWMFSFILLVFDASEQWGWDWEAEEYDFYSAVPR